MEVRETRVEIALAVALRAGRILVGRRPGGAHLAGTWEFPGGKIEDGETPPAAARRELREEAGLTNGEIEPLLVVAHDYSDRAVRLHVYLVREPQGEPAADPARAWTWHALDALDALEMPAANAPILRALRFRLGA